MMLRALLTIGGVQVITMLVLLVRTKTLALVLGPELVGVMAVIDKLLAVIAQTGSLSLPFAALKFLPERWTAGPSEFHALFTQMRNVLLAVIFVAATGALLVSVLEPSRWGEALRPYNNVVTVALITLPIVGLIPFLQNAFAGRMQQNRAMFVGLLHAFVLATAIVGIWSGGLMGYYATYAVLGSVLVVGITRMVTKDTDAPAPQRTLRQRFALGLPSRIWRFSGALLILTFLVPYAALFVHYRLLSDHGAAAAGWMQAAIGISLSVRAVMGSAHGVFLTPNINRGGSPQERMEWANQYQITFCLLAGLFVPPLLLFPDLVVYLLYSSDFAPGATFVMLFVLIEVLGLLIGTYQSLVVALDHMRVYVANNLVAQLLVVVGAYLLVGPLGILGAGLASLMAPLFLYIATVVFLNRSYGLRMPRYVVARAGWLLLGLVVSGLTGALLQGPIWTTLPSKGIIYIAVVSGFACLLTSHERQRAREVLRGWMAK